MEIRKVLLVARKELRDALRSRWFQLYTLTFVLLALVMASVAMAGTRMSGLSAFGRTTAGLVNLVLMIVPLMGLTTGAGAISGERERGTLVYLLSQPVSRLEVLMGKFMGLWLALTLILVVGFGIAGVLMTSRGKAGPAMADYLRLVFATDLLAAATLAVGLTISVWTRHVAVATGIAVFAWLALVFLTDLGLMGAVIAFRLNVDTLFYLAIANPLQSFKLSVLSGIHANLDVLGPAGMFASDTCGRALSWLLFGSLALWIAVPLSAAGLSFSLRGDA